MKQYLIFTLLFCMMIACNNTQNTNNNNTTTTPNSKLIAKGNQLFMTNCANCHKKNEDYTGPSLAKVSQRWPNKTLLYEYIRNSQDVIKKDAYAQALYQKWNQSIMLNFPQLTDEEITAMLIYLDN